jgi:hypothetical protein
MKCLSFCGQAGVDMGEAQRERLSYSVHRKNIEICDLQLDTHNKLRCSCHVHAH